MWTVLAFPGGILMSLRLQLRVSLCVDVAPLR